MTTMMKLSNSLVAKTTQPQHTLRQGNTFIRFQGLGVELPLKDAFVWNGYGPLKRAEENTRQRVDVSDKQDLFTELKSFWGGIPINRSSQTIRKSQYEMDYPQRADMPSPKGFVVAQQLTHQNEALAGSDQLIYLHGTPLNQEQTEAPHAILQKEANFLGELLKGLRHQVAKTPGALDKTTSQPLIHIGVEHRLPEDKTALSYHSYLSSVGAHSMMDSARENGMNIVSHNKGFDTNFESLGTMSTVYPSRLDAVGKQFHLEPNSSKTPMTIGQVLQASEAMVRSMIKHPKP
jgi:hypothetical protein